MKKKKITQVFERAELKYFFKLINDEVDNINSIDNALTVMRLTQGELL